MLYEEYDQATNALGKIEVCNFLAFLEHYGEAMGLLEAKINDLIEKLKFEKEILKYIDEKKDDILIRQIDEHFDELDSIYRVFYDSGFCIFGGTFEGVDDLDITYENITVLFVTFPTPNYPKILQIKRRYSITVRKGIEGSGLLLSWHGSWGVGGSYEE